MFLAFFSRQNQWVIWLFCLLLLLSGCAGQSSPAQHTQKPPIPPGKVTEFAVGGATSIVAGPDGNLWFARFDKIGRMTPKGIVTTFPIPTPN